MIFAIALAISPAFAQDKADQKGYDYLALGGSISSGFDPPLLSIRAK